MQAPAPAASSASQVAPVQASGDQTVRKRDLFAALVASRDKDLDACVRLWGRILDRFGPDTGLNSLADAFNAAVSKTERIDLSTERFLKKRKT